MDHEPTSDDLRRIYADTKTIAVVGASTDPDKAAHVIPAYLQAHGYRIIPVSPRGGEIFGERVRTSLEDVDEPIDVVQVFRPPHEGGEVAKAAGASGAKVIWFQPGTSSEGGVRIAEDAGLTVVRERCMGVMHGALGLGPGPY